MSSDSLEVYLLGSGGAIPYSRRSNAATCIVGPNYVAVVDPGSGTIRALSQIGIPLARLDAIFLTHTHADHCLEVPLLILGAFLEPRSMPLTILGPVGTRDHVDAVLALFAYIPLLVEEVSGSTPQLVVIDLPLAATSTDVAGITFRSAPTRHHTPSLGYRFEASDIAVVVSGDTEPCDSLAELARGVDLLIHDCSFPPDFGDVPGHTNPVDLGRLAHECGTKRLALTHLFEETVGMESEILAAISKNYSGPVDIGEDLLRFTLGGR